VIKPCITRDSIKNGHYSFDIISTTVGFLIFVDNKRTKANFDVTMLLLCRANDDDSDKCGDQQISHSKTETKK